ncbi:nucleoporin [Phakopsora pachyrhizi]|nr:nucleoporin [Phakopsora pachyrhizi]
MFGASNNTFGSFGVNNQQGQQPQPQQTGGLFGAQSSSGFNAFNQQQPASNSFSQSQTPAFGSNAFGTTSNTPAFGSAPASNNAFGQPQSTATSLFGAPATAAQPATNTGFGGFGGNAAPATSTFGTFGGANNTATSGTGLFGQKPATNNAFGTGTSGFGGAAFGQNATTTTPFGAATNSGTLNGTSNPPYAPITLAENESTPNQKSTFNSIVAMDAYKNYSFEELRFQDYQQGRKSALPANTLGGAFGVQQQPQQPGAFGTFNNTSAQPSPFGQLQQPQSSMFGNNTAPNNAFGAQTPASNNIFGQAATNNQSPFGQTQNTASSSPFGAAQPSNNFGGGSLFNSGNNAPNNTAFGAQPAKPSIFGVGTTGGAFGAPAASNPAGSIFGSANAQPQGGLFGAANNQGNTAGGGLFGSSSSNTASGGLFGANNNQNNAQKPGGLFGSSTGAATTLFGQPAQSSNTLNTGFGFGQNSQQPQQTGGLFGNNNQQQSNASGGLFGANNNQQPQAGTAGGLFGNNIANNANAGSTFNTSSGGLFGNNNNIASGGLFGNKPANPSGSLFGSTAPVNQNNTNNFGNTASGGLFGSSQNNSNPLLAGGNNNSLFGSSITSQPFASQPNNSGGLFQSLQNSQPVLQAKIDQDAYGTNPLFANHGITAGSKSTSVIKKQLPVIDFKPQPRPNTKITKLRGFSRATSPTKSIGYGSPNVSNSSSVVSRSSAYGNPSEEPLLSPKAFIVRPSPKRLTIEPSGISNLLRNRSTTLNGSASPSRETPPPLHLNQRANGGKLVFNPDAEISAQEIFSKNPHTISRDMQAAVDSRTSSNAPTTPKPLTGSSSSYSIKAVQKDQPVDQEGSNSRSIMEDEVFISTKEKARAGEYWTCPSIEELKMMSREDLKAVPNFTAGRVGYGQIQFQEDVDLTGIADLNEGLCGEVIVFKQLLCSVYPEDPVDKPPNGQGLNVPAVITLENCWKIDKATRLPIRDPDHVRVKQFVKRLMKSEDTQFIEYDAKLGKWTFSVEHFTTYGIDDSEEDSDDEEGITDEDEELSLSSIASDDTEYNATTEAHHYKSRGHSKRRTSQQRESSAQDEEDAPPQAMLFNEDDGLINEDDDQIFDTSGQGDGTVDEELTASVTDSDDGDSSSGEPSKKRSRRSTDPADADDTAKRSSQNSQAWRNQIGLESRKVAVMQASLFAPQDTRRLNNKSLTPTVSHASFSKDLPTEKYISKERLESKKKIVRKATPITALNVPATKQRIQHKVRFPSQVSLIESHASEKESSLVDANLSFGRSFRTSWVGQSNLMVHLKSGEIGNMVRPGDREDPSFSQLAICKIPFNSFQLAKEVQLAERLLNVQLRHTKINVQHGLPAIVTDSKLRFRHFYESYDKASFTNDGNIWSLCSVLFDEMRLDVPRGASTETVERITKIRREDGFSSWLQKVVAPDVEQDVRSSSRQNTSTQDSFGNIFKLLTGNQVERACHAAIQAGNYRLATLISQCGRSDLGFKTDVLQQTLAWREQRVDAYIDRDLRKIYELIAGNVSVSKGFGRKGLQADYSEDIIITENLDWKRSLGLQFWFAANSSNFWNSIKAYEESFRNGESAPPLPWYAGRSAAGAATEKEAIMKWKSDPQSPTYDAIFHIIQMFVYPAYSLETALEPKGFGPSPFDYRMPWHLYILFSRVLRGRDFEDREIIIADMDEDDTMVESGSSTAETLTCQYADQLTKLGLFKWAVFVLLHLESVECRERAVKSYLSRNINSIDDKTGEFLTQVLMLPQSWIHAARAELAHYEGNLYEEYKWLMRAEKYGEAHRIAFCELAPEPIIRGDLKLLAKLFDALPIDRVPEWSSGGKIYLDYIKVVELLPRLVKGGDLTVSDDEASVIIDTVLPGLLRDVPCMFRKGTDKSFLSMKQKQCVNEMMSNLTSTSMSISLLVNQNNHQRLIDHIGLGELPESDKLVWTQRCAEFGFMKALKRAGAVGITNI